MPIEESLLSTLRSLAGSARIPQAHDSVHKDECMLSFDTPYSPGGLFVNLNSWQGFGREWVERDNQRTGNRLYLHAKFTHIPRVVEESEPKEITKVAIGVEGGFALDDKFETAREFSVAVLPEFSMVPVTDTDLPANILAAAQAVIEHQGVASQVDVQAWEEEVKVSQYAASLIQEAPTEQTRPSPNPGDWMCPSCGAKENLWFNLGDGYIGCGRRNWDGSGGCGAALEHYKATNEIYPLAVKLGTITPDSADVFSYGEDDMVKDPNLAEHLGHWGIDIMKQRKYEKTMAEMTIELNKTFEFMRILEDGAKLENVTGPGFIGLKNLGNSCYMNSIIQTVFQFEEMQAKYFEPAMDLLGSAPADPSEDWVTQAAKLSLALNTDKYVVQSQQIEEQKAQLLAGQTDGDGDSTMANAGGDEAGGENGVKNTAVAPRMFRRLVGKGHQAFSGNRMQDCVEYFEHVLEVMNRAERASERVSRENGLRGSFRFQLEERLQCMASGQVRYSTGEDLVLRIPVDVLKATNGAEVAEYQDRERKRQKLIEENPEEKANNPELEKVVPLVPFEQTLRDFMADTTIDGWLSPATGEKGSAQKSLRIKTFPKYLAVAVQRYYLDATWVAKKHEVLVPVPLEFDFEFMRGQGLQAGEVELPKGDGAASSGGAAAMEPDATIVQTLMAFGMASENACKRAALAVQNANADMAAAWLFEHMGDADINDPVGGGASSGGASGAVEVDPIAVSTLMGMGFTDEQATVALKSCNGDAARAGDWLFSHMDDLEQQIAAFKANEAEAAAPAATIFPDGPGQYRLRAVVSHLGSNTESGHYVCHIRKNDEWFIFNDDKVAKSLNPPFDLGYLYFFERA